MKKIIILCVLLCALTFSVYAQLNVGAYTKSYWIPYRLTIPEEGDILHTTAVQVPWGGPDISSGINVDGWSEWGGIHLGVEIANGAGNQAAHPLSAKGSGWVWVKPLGFTAVIGLDTFTVWLGTPYHEQLMGQIGGSNLTTYVLNRMYYLHDYRLEYQNQEYNTFTRFNPYHWGNGEIDGQNISSNIWWPRVTAAALLTWEPVKNLFIGFFVAPEMQMLGSWGSLGGADWANGINIGNQKGEDDIDQDYYDAKNVYKRMQVGVGYDIPGIGFARAQWLGMRNVLEAAFQVKALGDLVLDIGLKIPFEGIDKEDKDTYKKRRDFQASIAATYRNYDFRLMGRVDAAFAGSDSSGRTLKTRGLDLLVYLVPSYQLGVGTVGLDLGFEYEQKDDYNSWQKDSMQAGIGLWFGRSMGNANFKIAAVTRLPLHWENKGSNWPGGKLPFELFFPIFLEVGF